MTNATCIQSTLFDVDQATPDNLYHSPTQEQSSILSEDLARSLRNGLPYVVSLILDNAQKEDPTRPDARAISNLFGTISLIEHLREESPRNGGSAVTTCLNISDFLTRTASALGNTDLSSGISQPRAIRCIQTKLRTWQKNLTEDGIDANRPEECGCGELRLALIRNKQVVDEFIKYHKLSELITVDELAEYVLILLRIASYKTSAWQDLGYV